jgi:hypothetical protein
LLTGPSVSQFCVYVDAVLSQNLIYQSDDLLEANSSPLDQARYHPNVKHSCLINFNFISLGGLFIRIRFSHASTAPFVQILFLYLALFAAIIFLASLDFIFAAVSLPTTERTPKIATAGIAWVGEK